MMRSLFLHVFRLSARRWVKTAVLATTLAGVTVSAVATEKGAPHGSATTASTAATAPAVPGAPLQGTVADTKGGMIAGARVTARNLQTGLVTSAITDGTGHFAVIGLPVGAYDITATAPGFSYNTQHSVQIASTPGSDLALTLNVGSSNTEVTVDADSTGSVAAALAPMDARLDATSARTEITQAFINNFTSPVSDYGEAVEMAPSTFTVNGNGVGLGQSKTYFRGFPDGDYDIDFDGIPFFDTNTPSHHSWAFFPAQFLGGIDFDRSPGSASTIGPTPFGGSIHLLSKEFSPLDNIRGTFSGGSFHTLLYDGAYDSGFFGPGHKLNLAIDVHHLQSNGYQTFNYQTRNAGDIKFGYKISDKTQLTGFSGVIWLDANTPNFSATRCQMYGAQSGYTCTGTLAPFAGSGINFLNTDNSDPANYLDYQYNYYHVPTDFEYVGLHTEFGHGFALDIRPYTYNYDNSEKYTNATPITEAATINGSKTYNGLAIAPCNVPVVKKGVTAIPCGVDKYNSYRKYGETSELSQVSHFGIFHAGLWWERANTNRHQYPTDPLNNWADQALPNFAEKFVSSSYQPFAEYEFRALPRLTITPGVKFAYYTIGTQQFADNGKTIGGLGANNPNSFITNGGSYFATLPSGSVNYRILNNWSAYAQIAQGSIVPPSSVFDFQQGTTGNAIPPATLPKQQKNTTYQFGTVLKLKRVTFDADYFHIHFDNSYSSVLNPAGEPVFFVQPSSITQGFEAESNIYLVHGLSLYLNAGYDRATYLGSLAATCTGSTAACATGGTLNVNAPGGLFVQQTPSDIEAEGLTYQHKAFDFGIFNKRVGTFYIDNGAYHNQATIDPFGVTNLFFNYTLHSSGRFDQTKFRVSFNNLFDEHNITGNSIAGTAAPLTINSNGTTYTDPFSTAGATPINGGDNVSVLPGRSVMLSVTFGFGLKQR